MPEADFQRHCNQCGDCIGNCPEKLLGRDAGGFPVLDFERGGCTFCGSCRDGCRTGALARLADMPPWGLRATLETRTCLSWRGVECRSCVDWCEPRAIHLQFAAGTPPRVRIDPERCTGCGSCLARCPAGALRITPESHT